MYSDEERCPTPKRLTEAELQKSVDRLTRNTRTAAELKPLAPRQTISQEALGKRVHHLYDESLARRQLEREEIARQMEAAVKKDSTMTVTTISQAEEEALVRHLYDDTLALKKKNFDELMKQETSHNVRNTRKMTKKEQETTADRLYREGMERERRKHIDLYEKYVISRRQPAAQRTTAEMAASADKMTRGEGVTS
ncbi:hypothetical protein ABB37_03945 [Leptomonas pyrrhocoris]|uniref:Uncharacterized protein n=1 Tax=Leptomonas pyrrhocoris TaxID=157538 RepID=A0A0N0DWD0_LEPPY|nr:hypothetical protein ABB37_03945 [Leptomonas pyrrhocoris]XP_015660053.1 hypothetical protein ABB37_03945 [Leptomonas pyrrhocoris]XP_015660054.1 hypothetical protein ABB37_03945 [Leptomonas pyrrhocoris]XP_015660055.1 hypothetical protein ABB37_03945 [Leptomonas pyrrhocoris]KPA81613.1 hypothetical protein ABB37_03945 [Leptomonas pyrrhocoris]KPA81614.1 hypothetical protein ABB37_03945 [Leptomonas pyrrhocoris]KPA81615.1 hypothetical protein ABB37_03945 [Leptomonas pyrrhocoris]KPA81616.1 hypot|eukprot:XP_015660052.1 hypothetical protein ABB37_03945 [Leptomonas pyrrhocoris]